MNEHIRSVQGWLKFLMIKGEPFEAITLGGRLQIDPREKFTACTSDVVRPYFGNHRCEANREIIC